MILDLFLIDRTANEKLVRGSSLLDTPCASLTAISIASMALLYSDVWSCSLVGLRYSLSSKEEQTTETLERAIAAEPIQGCIFKPRGENTPAATGTPTRL